MNERVSDEALAEQVVDAARFLSPLLSEYPGFSERKEKAE